MLGLLLGIVFILFPIVYGVRAHVRLNDLLARGTEAPATVTFLRGLNGFRTAGGSVQIFVSYSASDGTRHTSRLHIRPRGTYIGQSIAILYHPNDPRRVTAVDRSLADPVNEGAWGQAALLLPVALGVFLVAFNIRSLRRIRREGPETRVNLSACGGELHGDALRFAETVAPEHRTMERRLIWRDPFVKLLRSRETVPYFIVAVFLVILLEELDPRGGWITALTPGVSGDGVVDTILAAFFAAFVCFGALFLFQLLMVPVRKRQLAGAHKDFLAMLRQLDDDQAAALLAEYPARKSFGVFYHRKKGRKTSGVVYVTDSFLFIPGLLLAPREMLEDITLIFDQHGGRGVDWFETSGHSEIRFVFPDVFPVVFPLRHNYHKSPETAERIMAWFWQFDPDDPGVSVRTRQAIVSSRGKQVYRA